MKPDRPYWSGSFNLRYAGEPMTLHGVRRWLVGETVPSQSKMDVLADWLGVDATFLATGRRALEVRNCATLILSALAVYSLMRSKFR
jgi:hypothetical protein